MTSGRTIMKPGSLEPSYTITARNNGAPLDISEAQSVKVIGWQGVAQLFVDDDPAGDREQGEITHDWVGPSGAVPGETDAEGRIFLEAEVVLANGRKLRFPTFGHHQVDIIA